MKVGGWEGGRTPRILKHYWVTLQTLVAFLGTPERSRSSYLSCSVLQFPDNLLAPVLAIIEKKTQRPWLLFEPLFIVKYIISIQKTYHQFSRSYSENMTTLSYECFCLEFTVISMWEQKPPASTADSSGGQWWKRGRLRFEAWFSSTSTVSQTYSLCH